MYREVPSFGMRAYSLVFSKYGSKETFSQSELDWVVSEPMRKKIFATLLRAGWIEKVGRSAYRCVEANEIFSHLLDFRVYEVIKMAKKPYAFTGLSAVELWSDYSYVQRGRKRSPYFVKVLRKDLGYWKGFFNGNQIPNYVGKGSTIGEFIILVPVSSLKAVGKDGLRVDSFKETLRQARGNEMYSYAYSYMKRKYGGVS